MFEAGAKLSRMTKNVLGTRVFERVGYFFNIALDLVFLADCLLILLIIYLDGAFGIYC